MLCSEKFFKICSWNVNGLRTKFSKNISRAIRESQVSRDVSRVIALETWLSLNSPDIVALQETMLLENFIIPKCNYQIRHKVSSHNKHRGLGFLIRNGVTVLDSGHLGIDRLFALYIRVAVPSVGVVIIYNMYIPNGSLSTSCELGKDVRYLYNDVAKSIGKERRRGHSVIVLGDFNTRNPDFTPHISTPRVSERVRLQRNFIARTSVAPVKITAPLFSAEHLLLQSITFLPPLSNYQNTFVLVKRSTLPDLHNFLTTGHCF